MKMRMLLALLVLSLCGKGPAGVEAASISVEADLSHPNLSLANPIDFTVRFPASFELLDLLTIDACWVGDGLDAGESVSYTPGLAGVGVWPGGATQFFRRLAFPASLGSDLSPFLDGKFDGIIYAGRYDWCHEIGGSCPVETTVTFDRLILTLDGTPVPEPSTWGLLAIGVAAVLGRSSAWRRARRHDARCGRRR